MPRRGMQLLFLDQKRVKVSAWKYICDLVIAVCEQHELED